MQLSGKERYYRDKERRNFRGENAKHATCLDFRLQRARAAARKICWNRKHAKMLHAKPVCTYCVAVVRPPEIARYLSIPLAPVPLTSARRREGKASLNEITYKRASREPRGSQSSNVKLQSTTRGSFVALKARRSSQIGQNVALRSEEDQRRLEIKRVRGKIEWFRFQEFFFAEKPSTGST